MNNDYIKNYNKIDAEERANKFFIIACINTFVIAPIIIIYGAGFLLFLGLRYNGPVASDYVLGYLYLDYIFTTAVTFIAALINKIKPGIFYKSASFIIIGSFILGFLLINVYNSKAKKDNIEKQEQAEKQKQEEQEQAQKEKIEQQEEKEKNIKNKLLEAGYKENNGKYYNNNFEVTIKDNLDMTFKKSVNFGEIKEYNVTSDLTLLDNILSTDNYYSSFSSTINTLFSLLFNKTLTNFNFKINDLKLSISQKESTLLYSVSSNKKHDIDSFKKVYLDVMLVDSNKFSTKKDLYDLTLNLNKNYIKYYDYPYLYLNENNNRNFCQIKIQENGILVTSSYCNGGTSNTYFNFNESFSSYDYIENDVKENYFKEAYIDVISNDLKYISNKIGVDCQLDVWTKQKIKVYLDNKDKKVQIEINENVTIEIDHLTNYFVKYIIK